MENEDTSLRCRMITRRISRKNAPDFSVKGFAYAVRRERAKSRTEMKEEEEEAAEIEMKTRGIVKREEEEEE